MQIKKNWFYILLLLDGNSYPSFLFMLGVRLWDISMWSRAIVLHQTLPSSSLKRTSFHCPMKLCRKLLHRFSIPQVFVCILSLLQMNNYMHILCCSDFSFLFKYPYLTQIFLQIPVSNTHPRIRVTNKR